MFHKSPQTPPYSCIKYVCTHTPTLHLHRASMSLRCWLLTCLLLLVVSSGCF